MSSLSSPPARTCIGPARFAPIEAALAQLRRGLMVVVCDERRPDSEGEVMLAAQFADAAAINFMATHACGLVSVALTGERCDELGLRPMAEPGASPHDTAFTVSVEAREGVSTGISAADRARTVAVAIDPRAGAHDLVAPGHVFPLRARAGGVLERPGHTEAAVDLPRLAGLAPAGVTCQVLNEDGTIARVTDLARFCATHDLPLVRIVDLIEYRRARERFVERVVETALPTRYGTFRAIGYRSRIDARDHVALVHGEVRGAEDVVTRLHRESLTGDVFGAVGPCRDLRVDDALRRLADEPAGILVYLAEEDRGSSLIDRLRAHQRGEQGLTSETPAPSRFGTAAEIIADLGVGSVQLMTNDPLALPGLQEHGITVTGQLPVMAPIDERNREYLRTKTTQLGHLLRAYDLSFMAVEDDGFEPRLARR